MKDFGYDVSNYRDIDPQFGTLGDFQELLLKEVSETGLFALARKQGMVTMQEDGVLKTLSGVTTFSEVEEITGKIEW